MVSYWISTGAGVALAKASHGISCATCESLTPFRDAFSSLPSVIDPRVGTILSHVVVAEFYRQNGFAVPPECEKVSRELAFQLMGVDLDASQDERMLCAGVLPSLVYAGLSSRGKSQQKTPEVLCGEFVTQFYERASACTVSRA